jgi:uncharacterized membrane protein
MATETMRSAAGGGADKLRRTAGGAPGDQLRGSLQNLGEALAKRALSKVTDRVSGTAGRLTDYAEGGGSGLVSALTGAKKVAEGKSPVKALLSGGLAKVTGKAKEKAGELTEAVKGAIGGGKGDGQSFKVTTIVEELEIGVPVRIAYDQWTRFTEFPSFMKKVEKVVQESDEKLSWTAQIFLSHRTWKSTIIEQVPDERIVWRSEGAKGYPDGTVTFHEVTPDLTRILLVIEYHPQGFFEKTANIWRAQGRRVRLEFKHFRRHVMTRTILRADELEGWRGEIRDGQVVGEGAPEEELPEGELPEEEREERPRHRAERESEEEPEEAVPAQRAAAEERERAGAGRSRGDRGAS